MAGAERAGLQRSQDPDRAPVDEGFDFLGFHFRRYPNGKLLIKPSVPAIKRFRRRLAKEFHSLRGANVAAVLAKITPIVRGWVAYYRTVVSARVFHALTHYLWKLAYKWACWSHPNKPKRWITQRYFGKFDKFRNDRWVFGDRDTGAYLPKPAWTDITRHPKTLRGRINEHLDSPDACHSFTPLRSRRLLRCSHPFPGGYSGVAPPDPIPNSEVKRAAPW